MQVFVTINNVGMMINVDANVKNWLIKVYAIKDMLGILVVVSVNAINHVMLVSNWIMKTVSVEKGWQMNLQRNVLKILMKQNSNWNSFIWTWKWVCMFLRSSYFLGLIAWTICIRIGAYFTYRYINRNKENVSTYDYTYHAKNC